MSTARFTVGIDLGTTNTALAFAPLDGKDVPAPFALEQVVAANEHAARPLLPSFVYLPADVELPGGALALPWDKNPNFCVGTFARERAASVPGRVVSSAKSWLCHAGVDRRSPLLPAGAPVNRAGFDISADKTIPYIIVPSGKNSKWQISSDTSVIDFESIYEMIQWIRR